MTQIIAIANPKGGVGKTTTAVSLAGALAEQGQDVLLIDLDPQSHLSLAMGVNPAKVRRSIVDVLLGRTGLYNAVRESRIAAIDILPARPELADVMLDLPPDPDLLKKAFAQQTGDADLSIYQWVLLDCPPSWNRIMLNALAIANLLLIPTQPEFFSTYSIKTVMEIIQKTRQANPDLAYRILITLQDPNNPVHTSLAAQIRTAFNAAVLETAINFDPRLSESAAAGFPINHFDPQAPAAQQYRALAQELIHHSQDK
jgi:chromosome partitioning protein